MMLVQTAFSTALPFLLAMDIAATSTWCDNLMTALNDTRKQYGTESHLKIQCLETTLKQLVRSFPPLSTTFVASFARGMLDTRVTRCVRFAGRTRGKGSVLC